MKKTRLSKLRKKRLLNDITLDEVYVSTGIDQGRLSRIERCLAEATEDEKNKLSEFYQCAIRDIFY